MLTYRYRYIYLPFYGLIFFWWFESYILYAPCLISISFMLCIVGTLFCFSVYCYRFIHRTRASLGARKSFPWVVLCSVSPPSHLLYSAVPSMILLPLIRETSIPFISKIALMFFPHLSYRGVCLCKSALNIAPPEPLA